MELSTLIKKAKAEQSVILESVARFGGEERISYKIEYAEKLQSLVGDVDVPATSDELNNVVSKIAGDDFSDDEIQNQMLWVDAVIGLSATL